MKGALGCLDWPAWGSEGSLSVPVAGDIVPVVEGVRRTATRSWVGRDDPLLIGHLAAHPLFPADRERSLIVASIFGYGC